MNGKLKLSVLSRYIANYSLGATVNNLLHILNHTPEGLLADRKNQLKKANGGFYEIFP